MIEEWELLTALTTEQAALVVYGLDKYKKFGKVTFQISLEEKRGRDTKELYDLYNKAVRISNAMLQDRKTLEPYGKDKGSKRELYTKASLYQWLVYKDIKGVGVESLKPNENAFTGGGNRDISQNKLQSERIVELEILVKEQQERIAELEQGVEQTGIPSIESLPASIQAAIEVYLECIHNLPDDRARPKKEYVTGNLNQVCDGLDIKQGNGKGTMRDAIYSVLTYNFRMGGKREPHRTKDWRPLSER